MAKRKGPSSRDRREVASGRGSARDKREVSRTRKRGRKARRRK